MGWERQHPDGDLLQRMRAGEEEAFATLYRRLQGPLYRFALHMSGSETLAEDVVQEVFMTLMQESGRFDPERGQLSAFLFGIARNHLLRRFERDRRMVPLPDSGADSGADGYGGDSRPGSTGNNGGVMRFSAPLDLARSETIERVREAVLSLPGHYREVVVLCDLQETSYEDAAEALQCPVGTVRSRLHRAREILAVKLREFRQFEAKPAVAGGRGRR
jgi:RNA polymerase sigma-70 factor (ECF subfamily)